MTIRYSSAAIGVLREKVLSNFRAVRLGAAFVVLIAVIEMNQSFQGRPSIVFSEGMAVAAVIGLTFGSGMKALERKMGVSLADGERV